MSLKKQPETLEKDQAQDRAETLALWEALAEPIEDPEAQRQLAEAIVPLELFSNSRRKQVEDFLAACDDLAAEAQKNGLTEEKLSEILND